jgi:acetyl-CoA carboxylase carboxyltransferase component
MATEQETKKDEQAAPSADGAKPDPQLEKQRATVKEVGREPTDTEHPGEVPRAKPTEHGEQSGLKGLVDDLHDRRDKIKLGGGPEKISQQHEKGKLTARERIDLLLDPGSFVELGVHGRPHFSQRTMEGKEAPADGVITGWGKVDGRPCAVVSYDFTVMAGSMGMTGELKVGRLRELALTKRMPFIWLLDSAGARIQEAVGSLFAGSGQLFREEVTMSGCVPLVAALMGPCAAGTAYIPGLADFVPMVSGQGSMALAGPYLVKAVTGEDVTQEELGGAKVHCRKSGVGGHGGAHQPEFNLAKQK